MDTIPVIFRAERHGQFKGDVTAVFPTEQGSSIPGSMGCYVHNGQHGSCSIDWYYTTRPAKPEEYAGLKQELEQIGYKLKVYKRITRAAIAKAEGRAEQ